jgi:pimeloyl-ACP methyl ester carboxylesterase
MSRLARKLDELLAALDVAAAVLVGHAMGCSVIWGYLELFRSDRVERLVLVDLSPVVVIDLSSPSW